MQDNIKLIIALLIAGSGLAFGQGEVVIPMNEAYGDPDWNFEGRMNGNRVFETFRNHGEIGEWNAGRQNQDDSDWPAGGLSNPYLDGIGIVVGASVIDSSGNLIAMTSAHYREEVDRSPDLETVWGWHPVPGYLNFDRINQVGTKDPIPASSNDATSWPSGGWPDYPDYTDEDGNTEWNGRFGRGKFNAQLESYYVMDDAIDFEHAFRPVSSQPDRGGLGIRGAVRLYQWSHPLAQDVIFAEFGFTNLGDESLDSVGFGWWVDNGVGNTGTDNGLFAQATGSTKDFDLAIGYNEPPGVDQNGLPTGLAGYAYLESPGIPDDASDNDRDGLVDERRGNGAGVFNEIPVVADPAQFFEFYGRNLGPHWSGDEDGDWRSFSDDNNNGIYDGNGESINDDVGSDGVGPGDLNYVQADGDGTEGNGRPDQGEPNFGRTDKDESDQLGMTYFKMIPVPGHANNQPNAFQAEWFSDDAFWWQSYLSLDSININELTGANLVMVFASGTFPLESRQTERFSMILGRTVGTEDDISKMLELKETVQAIYNTDYQFSQPPSKPTLTAVAGDRKVTLFWDDIAELSKDPFLNGANDFSGYRIYKSTDPLFLQSTIITDDAGSPILKKPIVIFDLKDEYKGPHPILLNGAPFDMGDETGLEHRFVDENVINGLTYYYAITAFDTGSTRRQLGPSENTTIIETNSLGQALFTDKNTAFVIPKVPAAGYTPPGVAGDLEQLTAGNGTGKILGFDVDGGSQIVSADDLVSGQQFRLSFKGTRSTVNRSITTTSYSVMDISGGEDIPLITDEPLQEDEDGVFVTGIFGGLQLAVQNDSVNLDIENSGWLNDDGTVSAEKDNWTYFVKADTGGNLHIVPHSDIFIKFLDSESEVSAVGRGGEGRVYLTNLPINITAFAADTTQLKIAIIDKDSSGAFELQNDAIQIWEQGVPAFRYNSYYYVEFYNTSTTPVIPGAGDELLIKSNKQFNTGDYFEFESREGFIDPDAVKTALKNKEVAVVPNPYVFTNPMDPPDNQRFGKESRLMFINVPASSTLRIFTLSGKLVRKIEINNAFDDGKQYWDLKNSEGLKVAPGIYIFHIKDESTGEEQLGRFVIIR